MMEWIEAVGVMEWIEAVGVWRALIVLCTAAACATFLAARLDAWRDRRADRREREAEQALLQDVHDQSLRHGDLATARAARIAGAIRGLEIRDPRE